MQTFYGVVSVIIGVAVSIFIGHSVGTKAKTTPDECNILIDKYESALVGAELEVFELRETLIEYRREHLRLVSALDQCKEKK